MNSLYPLKFKPVFKEKVWGGQKIRTELGVDFGSMPNCGEMWAISGVEESQSVIENGFLAENELNELVEIYMGELVGEKIFKQFGNKFPLLIKFIDANDWLSIQVHPDDELAQKRNIESGKTEMWYVVGAETESRLISGFNQPVNEEMYIQNLENRTLKEILNFEKVKKGDVFFIPSGRVHALGPGILIAEIQQTSDTTYRIYDWDRPGTDGKLRQLHTEDALEAIDFTFQNEYKTKYKEALNATAQLVDCPFFTTNLILFDKPVLKNIADLDSFVIYICLEGSCTVSYENGAAILKTAEVILIPASISNFLLDTSGQTRLLEIYIT